MEVTRKLIEELQNRLKVGNRRGVHLNAIPGRSRYKFDLHRLSYINENIPNDFIEKLLTEKPLKFKISWKDNVPDLNELFEEDQVKLVKITKSFENLINQTEAIESEKGINTFGFGFPILARRDQKDNKLTVAPILIWSLRIKRTREFNTWEIVRDDEDPIYLNEVLINHLESDSQISVDQISEDYLDDGLIDKQELLQICYDLLSVINSKNSPDLKNILREKLEDIKAIPDKKHFEKLPITSNNSFIDFSGLFSIFEVQKQNIIQDYDKLLELEGYEIDLEDMEDHHFQPISSVETDPSQQGILHSLESKRNILIQGPPGTGKSQSLTAILINALENHKKTIVVCEKQTALDVLHKALLEKGLGKHTTIIKDIIRDRRLAVDSVRDRVDYPGARHNTTWNTNLSYTIERAKKLIDSINSKHFKIGKKLAGDRNWTQTVGALLKNLKKIEENYDLNLDKKLFEYTSDELNKLLETLREGQGLYEDFKPFKNFTFLDPSKLIGENPFLIEREIKESLDEYKKAFVEVEGLIKDYKKDYIKLRSEEFRKEIKEIENQISNSESAFTNLIDYIKNTQKFYIQSRGEEIGDQIEKTKEILNNLIQHYDSSGDLVLERAEAYRELRKKEIEKQWNEIDGIQKKVQNLFDKNSQFTLFYQDDKKGSFETRIKSIFSSEIKGILEDSKKLDVFLRELINLSKCCSDFPSLNNAGSTAKKQEVFKAFRENCEAFFNNRFDYILAEYKGFNFDSFSVNDPGSQKQFIQDLKGKSEEISILQKHKEYLENSLLKFQEYLEKVKELETQLHSKISVCRDFDPIELSKKIKSKIGDTRQYLDYLNNIWDDRNSIAEKEFNSYFPELAQNKIDFDRSKSSLKSAFSKSSFKSYKDSIFEMQTYLANFEKKLTASYAHIIRVINNSNDIESISSYKGTDAKIEQIKRLPIQLKRDQENFDQNVVKEPQVGKFLNKVKDKYSTQNLIDLRKKLDDLRDKIINDGWAKFFAYKRTPDSIITEVKALLEISKKYFDHEEDIFTPEFKWNKFYNDLNSNAKKVINEIQDRRNWRNVFLVFYLDSLLTENADMHLPTDEKDHKELDVALSEFGKKQIDYIHYYWNEKQKRARNRFERDNPALSIENLYNKRKSHKHQKLSLRQVIKYDLDLFTDFFPIILTTPDVCSNMFQEKHKYFDIVLFDEASQLKLEDNLPALLKGKQIVIAGDEHQMPPSNYFSKIFDGSIDDEDDYEEDEQPVIDRDNILLSCESLLDFAAELKFNKRFLDFHYRSKHPYLIDFSNYAFYNQRLIPLPNNFDYTPIKHIQVNGTYSDHSNEKEADAVLSILENNINKLPNGKYPSVGIATFNIAQRNLIKSRILERRKFEKYQEFNDKILELEEEGLFVKNLENIQGDERDVIILSTTYGVNQDGKFNQRFGPINHQKGYKLLNVIITRAKYKVYLCTSIPEKVYLDYKSYLVTEGSNNRRAVFFAYLAYGKAVSENNNDARMAILHDLAENSNAQKIKFDHNPEAESPFEEEVYQVLASHFEKDKIIQQLQFAGFRIDMVYDPQHPGLPKIAIECDGASYHSSKEAYLYDRHRQKILESHGFVFHRIWSTNWWRNPKRETEQLINFIKSIESKDPELFEVEGNISDAFTDNIEIIRNELPFNDPEVQDDLIEEIDQIEIHSLKTEESPIKNSKRIKASSKVKVNYLNNDKEIIVELVENGAVKPDTSNGVMKINIKTPLGQALLGKTQGETVKIGKLDNYVEILEIMN